MSIQDNVKGERGREAGQKSPALRLAANAVFHHLIDPSDKARVLAAVRVCAEGRANAAQHQKLLAERARLIPSFTVFRMLVQEDLRAAYEEDRLHQTRGAKYRRLAWMTFFKPFAQLQRIDQALEIRALDRSGNYQCELVDKESPDLYARLIALGARAGIPEAELSAPYWRAQDRQAKRA